MIDVSCIYYAFTTHITHELHKMVKQLCKIMWTDMEEYAEYI